MYETIGQQVEVLVAFMRDRVLPLSFRWNNKKYSINNVNLAYYDREGRKKCYHYSVTSDGSCFKLSFDTESNQWFLQEAFYAA
ncbi:hypothetical protein KKC32_05190 [Patescibacteria group bacterium]|nr:hypothetical protein [Patescibacteria group bacterium]